MKKNSHRKMQSAFAVFIFSIAALNATEQDTSHEKSVLSFLQTRIPKDDFINSLLGQGGNASKDSKRIIDAVGKVSPDLYTYAFIDMISRLTSSVGDDVRARVIESLGKLSLDRYADFIKIVDKLLERIHMFSIASVVEVALKISLDQCTDFIKIYSQLTQKMVGYDDKERVMEALANVSQDRYADFIKIVGKFSQEKMDPSIIEAVGKVSPDRYTDAFIDMVNQLSQGMDGFSKARIIDVVDKVSPDRYTDAFIDMVNQVSQEMNGLSKARIIDVVGKVSSDRYTDAFIDMVNQLSQGMDGLSKARIIDVVGKVSPDRYTRAFISMVNQVSQEMNGLSKARIIDVVGKVSPDRYTRAFISMVNQVSQEMNATDKGYVIQAIGMLSADNYSPLQAFIRQYPSYFRYVPARAFAQKIIPNMTESQLQNALQQLHTAYRNNASFATPQALAFEIHNYASQDVFGETGQKQQFNKAVLEHIERSIQGPVLSYDTVLDLLRAELNTLIQDEKKSDAINQKVFNWVIERNETPQDKNAIALVVTYLEQKDNMHQKLSTWLYTFMEESKKAYDGMNAQSCTKGVKERVITSLRSAVPQGDVALENLFMQAESSLMIATKSKRLTDYAFWARRLQAEGVTSTTPQDVAKNKFSHILQDYFEGVTDPSVTATIEATLDAFEDSDSSGASLRLTSGDGLWSKIKAELIKLE
ncbi:MAG: hypothetical protein NEHIOOID_01047 [Holosporales bacterium]